MSLEAAELRRQEQMLLVCKENLQAAAEKAEALRDGIRQAWRSEETTYLLQALERISSTKAAHRERSPAGGENVAYEGVWASVLQGNGVHHLR